MNDKHVTVSAGIPPEMAQALISAQEKMPSLRKDERNAYGKYAYVPIDQFYQQVPKVAASFGLYWQAHELNYEIVGKEGGHIAYTFGFDLYYKDGTCLPNYSRITVIHPVQGAQTAGSALSYGDKLFMRTAFKIVTGEEDADATDSGAAKTISKPVLRQVEAAKPPAEIKEAMGQIVGGIADGGIKVTEEDGVPVIGIPADPALWPKVAEVFLTFVPECSTGKELNGFWTTNSGVLEKMEAADKDTYDKVKTAFTAHKTRLKEKK